MEIFATVNWTLNKDKSDADSYSAGKCVSM